MAVDWNASTWGDKVHESSDGSWVPGADKEE
jgi:hypothetical protein